ncbi:hypothetical protein AX16_002311 [Volvariella volvacea WC 439]|nr:hypothetical protein AX16_002311 [Volvariella volvacea WC 439]
MSTNFTTTSFSPQPPPPQPNHERIHPTLLGSYGIKYVRIEWVGMGNTLRSRVVPLSYFNKLLKSSQPSISLAQCALGIVFLSVPTEFSAIGEYNYVLDLNSIRLLPWAPGHAMIFGWFREKQMIERALHHDEVATYDPRTLLQRLVRTAAEDHNIQYLVGFESEFILLSSISPIVAVGEEGWSESIAIASGTTKAKVLEEIAEVLQAMGIELLMYHSEGAPGQYEVITGPLPPLEAADALIHTRETIYNVASKHGLRATFTPRLFNNYCGSASHTHISVRSTLPPDFNKSHGIGSDFLTLAESQFLAGLLKHLPALTFLTCPTYASYARMADGVWSGGTYVSWGRDNREAPIRLCNAHFETSRNFELKSVDGTANPYIVLSGILAAASLGYTGQLPLNVRECGGPERRSAADLSDEERKARGVHRRMPLNLEEAKKAFVEDEGMRSVLGEEFSKKFVSVNETLHRCLTEGFDAQQQEKLLVETF